MVPAYGDVTSVISIHAPREGGDISCAKWNAIFYYFNPRPPRGGRPQVVYYIPPVQKFQSTPPARGATFFMAALLTSLGISIHAPREGGDRHQSAEYP